MPRGEKFIFYGIVAGVLLGGVCGWFFGEAMQSVAFIGDLFLDALKMMVIPLVFFSLIMGITSLGDIRKVGRTGFYTVAFFLSTTVISVVVGLAAACPTYLITYHAIRFYRMRRWGQLTPPAERVDDNDDTAS